MIALRIGQKEYVLSNVHWIRKSGKTCNLGKDGKPDMICKRCGKEDGSCTSSMAQHCCKHVVRDASGIERAAFCRASGLKDIPEEMDGKILKEYQWVAEKGVLDGSPVIGLDFPSRKEGGRPAVYCASMLPAADRRPAEDDAAIQVEMVDYLIFPTAETYKKGEKNPVIISMYSKGYDFETAWLLYSCYMKYEENVPKLYDRLISPGLGRSESFYACRFPRSKAAMEYAPLFAGSTKQQCELAVLAFYCAFKRKDTAPVLQYFASLLAEEIRRNKQPLRQFSFPTAQEICGSPAFKFVCFNLPSFRNYVTLCNLRKNADFLNQVLLQQDPSISDAMKYRFSQELKPYFSDCSSDGFFSTLADTIILWYTLQAEKQRLTEHYFRKISAYDRDGEKKEQFVFQRLLEEVEGDGEKSRVFDSTFFVIASCYYGYSQCLDALNSCFKLLQRDGRLPSELAKKVLSETVFYNDAKERFYPLLAADERFRKWSKIFQTLFGAQD